MNGNEGRIRSLSLLTPPCLRGLDPVADGRGFS
jgi:hypothetical protein